MAPDGERFVMSLLGANGEGTTSANEIIVVENFSEVLKRLLPN